MTEVEELFIKLTRPPKLLLVESDRATAKAFRASLDKYECAVDWVTSGDEAVERVSTTNYDMIFVDDSLHKIMDVLRYLKRQVPSVPIVILGCITKLLDIGLVTLLPKNIDVWDLETLFRTFKIPARTKSDTDWFWQPVSDENGAMA